MFGLCYWDWWHSCQLYLAKHITGTNWKSHNVYWHVPTIFVQMTICSCILFICLSLTIFLFQWQLKICILCGFIGHLHWNCHQRGCFRCGCPGHMTRDCTEPSFSKWHPCFRCGMQGHNKKVMVFVCISVNEIGVFLLKKDL